MRNLLFISLVIVTAAGCGTMGKSGKVKESSILNKEVTTGSGLTYKITHEGDGPKAKAGDMVSVHYTGRLKDSTIFDSSVGRGKPFSFRLGSGQVIKGWDEGIALLNKGDKATLTIPSQLGYGDRDMGDIPPNSTLYFDVELVDIRESVKPWTTEKATADSLSSGLKIFRYNRTEGETPKAGQNVSVHYSGYLEDGSLFDSSVERGEPISFTLGVGQVIKGWDEGIGQLRKGEKAKLVIPYQLAYGEGGRPPVIPQKATLIFDVELVDFH